MFGLMRFGSGQHPNEEHRRWRMHYCGTCKTIGSRYGQCARLLLNHDAAFLAELLDSLTGADAELWSDGYRSWNCMRLPADGEMPLLLRYTAAANVLLGEYKVRDHEADSGHRRWTWVRRWLSPAFRKAQSDLAEFGFPLKETSAILARQSKLEATPGVSTDEVAAPTAEVTSLVFRHGAQLAGLDQHGEAIADLGYRFGRLIYLIDAWQDFDRDGRTGAFNPLRSSGAGRDWAARQIREESAAIAKGLEGLGAPAEFRMRLQANVERALDSTFSILSSCSTQAKQTMAMRWREAIGRARMWKAPLRTFALVTAMAFLFPRHARLARSARECLSLGLNLMALGGMVAMVAGPGTVVKSKLRSWCSSCCCDPGCDCCCEGCCDSCGDGCCDACGSCDCG